MLGKALLYTFTLLRSIWLGTLYLLLVGTILPPRNEVKQGRNYHLVPSSPRICNRAAQPMIFFILLSTGWDGWSLAERDDLPKQKYYPFGSYHRWTMGTTLETLLELLLSELQARSGGKHSL
jgi:hypothetical protein